MQLVAKTPTERRLKEYLDANASEALREKIAALPDGARFNLGAAWTFCTGEARKKLNSRSGYLEDEVVFGWLIHYYEDVAPAEAAKPAPAKAKEEAKTRSARKGASPKTDQPAAQTGSSKLRTKKEGRLVSARKGASPGTHSTAQGEARPSSLSASSAPPPAESTDSARRTGGGAASSPDPATGPSTDAERTILGPRPGESTPGVAESGFSFVLFDGGAQ
ncbi:MAG: hypothetical protein IJL06_06065 [Kiritimatiellae bacterium]|nr:hypothetical protein [Kiritimatiellia bacterium]